MLLSHSTRCPQARNRRRDGKLLLVSCKKTPGVIICRSQNLDLEGDVPSLSVVRTVVRELVTLKRVERVNEPDLVMDDPEKVAAYTRAGREDGVMASVYLFHCAQICEVVRPGGVAVDLGCGPATQLGMVARLNPETRFIGVDLSEEMLERARGYVAEQGLNNVQFRQGDISSLDSFADNSVDTVFSTVALHHLPDEKVLAATFSEVSRVLKPGGSLYLVDFGRLKSEKSIDYFASQYANQQADLFTLDYLYSLKAAFTLGDFKRTAARHLPDAKVSSTFLMPFMVVIKSQSRFSAPNAPIIQELHRIRDNLPPSHRTDLNDLKGLFRMGGLSSPLL